MFARIVLAAACLAATIPSASIAFASPSPSPSFGTEGPGTQPVVHAVEHAPGVYEEGVWAGGNGVLGKFVFRNGGDDSVVEYRYGFGGAIVHSVSAARDHRGRSARVDFRPEGPGLTTLDVRALDASGALGPIRSYEIRVDYPRETGRWDFSEGSGSVARDRSGKHHDLSLSPTTTWTDGLVDSALQFDEVTDQAVAESSVVGTRNHFTVSAWVQLDSLTSTGVAVSADGTHRSGFNLGYVRDDGDCPTSLPPSKAAGCFAMWAPDSDAAGDTQYVRALSPEPVTAGEWYVLVGVYNRGAPAGEQLRIYSCSVNGSEIETGSADRRDGWRADGPLRVGQGEVGGAAVDRWTGDVDTVTVYKGAMDEGDVRRKCAGAE